MSASNWTSCPRCALRRMRSLQAMRDDVTAKYGQIPVAEFDELRRQLTEAENAQPEQTLREDYEFWGAQDGEVVASYSNSCTKCGLKTEFTHRHEIDVAAS